MFCISVELIYFNLMSLYWNVQCSIRWSTIFTLISSWAHSCTREGSSPWQHANNLCILYSIVMNGIYMHICITILLQSDTVLITYKYMTWRFISSILYNSRSITSIWYCYDMKGNHLINRLRWTSPHYFSLNLASHHWHCSHQSIITALCAKQASYRYQQSNCLFHWL